MHLIDFLDFHLLFLLFIFFKRSQSWSLRQKPPFSTLSWKEEIWILWSSFGFGWEKVSQATPFRKPGFVWFSITNWQQRLSITGVTSYQDIGDCMKLVIDALRYGDIKPWVKEKMFELVKTVNHKDIFGFYWKQLLLFCFTSPRFTETAAVLSASSFCSPTTNRSSMCLWRVSHLSICC